MRESSALVNANNLTKFGPGTLLLSGTSNTIFGNFTVQQGTLKIGGQNAVTPSPYATNLVLNDAGTLDLKKILHTATQTGVKHFFVEQDETAGDPLASAKMSASYLKSLEI